MYGLNYVQNIKEAVCHVKETKIVVNRDVKKQNVPTRTKSEPNLGGERGRERHRHRRKGKIKSGTSKVQQFGYEIQDVDGFLAKVSKSLVKWCLNLESIWC